MTFAEQVLSFYKKLKFKGTLPEGIEVLNPYKDNKQVLSIAQQFYGKFYNDRQERKLILGINPGRLGAGATGIPFTDTKRLRDKCGIEVEGFQTHEPSSVFVYNMIDAYGGAEIFYKHFYISSVCPLGFVSVKDGKEVNYNYYDSKSLEKSITPFAIETIKAQLDFGISREVCFCMGTGKNYAFLKALNDKQNFFERVIPLEHPRYVMQYKSKLMDSYINKYLEELSR